MEIKTAMEKRLDNIDLTPAQSREVRGLLKRHLPNVEVWAYGSRVTFKAQHNSDLDLVAFAGKEQRSAVYSLISVFEESDLPFSVDVMIWDAIPEHFKPSIRRAYYVLQERPLRQIPNSKKQMKLIDFAELNPKVEIRKGEPYPFLEMKDINPQARYISTTKMKAYKGSGAKFMPGDTLFARITPCLENGKISQYRGAPNAPAWGSTEFIVLRGKQGVSDTNFVYYLSQFSEFRDFAIKQMEGTSGRQRVAHSAIAKFSYEFPSLVKQKAIAHVLGLLDDKIEHNHKVSETLEETAKAIFRSWFVDFAPVRAKMEGRPTGLSPDINALFPEKLTQSKIGEIPQGWEINKMSKIVNCVGGTTPSTTNKDFWHKGDIAWATPKDLSESKDIYLLKTNKKINSKGLATIPSGLLPVNSVLLSSRAPIGYLALTSVPTAINQGFIGLIPNDSYSSYFLLNWCKANMGKIKSRATGTTFTEVNKASFRSISLKTPPKAISVKFEEMVAPIYEKILLNSHGIELLAETRDTLLPKLLSGEAQIADAEKLIKNAGI